MFAGSTDTAATTLSPEALGGPDYSQIGSTPNFTIFAQAVLGDRGVQIANALLAGCEGSYSTLLDWFAASPAGLPFKVYVTKDINGAMHFGCNDTEIYVGTNDASAPTNNGYNLLLAAELVEVFSASINPQWNCGFSNGEGLSRVLANAIFPQDELRDFVTSSIWLDKTTPGGRSRQNWVDQTDPEDTNGFSIGCSVLFLNWLRFVLELSWSQISGAGASTLAQTYQALTNGGDAWTRFKADMDARFPPGQPSNLTTDNPFV
ncbi:MAG TPA: hypothetical protein VHR45_01640 [Thermoanaerobaculia bacterium]|nr:hypothetical protein [Thermoanaerobaculia bacterium]